MSTRDEIMQALASAASLDEQIKLVAELDALDDAQRQATAAQRSLDWADTTVRDTLTPVATFDRHTASSDWLGEADTRGENHHQKVIAEASLWFGKLDPDVKADAHEFVAQARGIARRTAGRYGEAAEEAEGSFLQYVAFLNRQVLAASGLDQVQQRVDSFENPKQTPLNPEVFDNFAPPVHPLNTGVDGTQQNSLAPGAEEAMSESGGSGVGRPSEHDDDQEPVSQPYYPPASAKEGSLDQPSMAIGYLYNLDEFLRAEAANDQDLSSEFAEAPDASGEQDAARMNAGPDAGYEDWQKSKRQQAEGRKAGGVAPFVRESTSKDPDDDGDDDTTEKGDTDKDYAGRKEAVSTESTDPFPLYAHLGGCRICSQGGKNNAEIRKAIDSGVSREVAAQMVKDYHSRSKEAASGLPQVQQQTDVHDQPARTSLPTDVMFPVDQPWPEHSAEEFVDQGGESYPGRTSTGTPSRHESVRKQADMYGASDQPHAAPGTETPVANSAATTPPRANEGDYSKGVANGQADAQAGNKPSFMDNSSNVSDYVRGYIQGYGNTPVGNGGPQDIPGSMGGDSGQGMNFGNTNARTEKPLVMARRKTADGVSERKREHAEEHGHTLPGTDKFPIENARDLANAKHDIGRTNEPKDKVRSYINERAKALGEPGLGESKESMKVSASLISKDVSGDKEFQRGYRYAFRWTKGTELVAIGSNGEEAGIYAGITDNPTQQAAWVRAHRTAAREYPELRKRLQSHKTVTANLRRSREDLPVKGLYVQAATSLDLDTMSPSTNPDPQGATPFMGPGTVPPLRGAPGTPAAPGGPAPYNGAAPMGGPVVDDPAIQDLDAVPRTMGEPEHVNMGGNSSITSNSPQVMGRKLPPEALAFRKTVQAAKLALRQKNGSN